MRPSIVTSILLASSLGPAASWAQSPRPTPIVRTPGALRPGAGGLSRTVERRDPSGRLTFAVTLRGGPALDRRLLDYAAGEVSIRPLDAALRRALPAWKPKAGSAGADLTVSLVGRSGAAAADFIAVPPAGFTVVQPGVFRATPALIEALARAPGAVFPAIAPTDAPPAPPPPPPAASALHVRLTCRAKLNDGGASGVQPLPFLPVTIGGASGNTNASGELTLSGAFAAGPHEIHVKYDGTVTSHGVSTPLRIRRDTPAIWTDHVTAPGALAGSTVELGVVELATVNCELWRLGAAVLTDYHQAVGQSPPAGELKIKRWDVISASTPHAFYTEVVIPADFGQSGRYADVNERLTTLTHEAGHSVRHAADGDESHWHYDNFRFVYGRSHNTCETFNAHYAFNEGWGGYWGHERAGDWIRPCNLAPALLDWTEAMIAERLSALAQALSADRDVRSRKMVEVLTANPGSIHSLWEFERAYCKLHAATSNACIDADTPKRIAPASCPPDYRDDGVTCAHDDTVPRESQPRGAGEVPTECGPGRELDAGLCYPRCGAGYSGRGPVCWQQCPSGMRDDGGHCAKPEAYGRGAGYPWKIGDRVGSLDAARARCEAKNPDGCQKSGAMYYPKCKPGFHATGCCVCSPDCPAGMTDIGVSCQKRSSTRGAGTVPKCAAGLQADAGLCYTPCPLGFTGAGPVCWAAVCPPSYATYGALCSRSTIIE